MKKYNKQQDPVPILDIIFLLVASLVISLGLLLAVITFNTGEPKTDSIYSLAEHYKAKSKEPRLKLPNR